MIKQVLVYLITTVLHSLSELMFDFCKCDIIVYTAESPILRVNLLLHVNLELYRTLNFSKVNRIGLNSNARFIDVCPVGAHVLFGLCLFVNDNCDLSDIEWFNFPLWAFVLTNPSMVHS